MEIIHKTISVHVTPEFITNAEEEIFQILLKQRLAFNQRWRSGILYEKIIPLLRVSGLSLSVIGLLLSLYLFSAAPLWCPVFLQSGLFITLFILFTITFYYLPKLETKIRAWTDQTGYSNCKKLAARCVKAALDMAPYQAEYEINGNRITYYRCKDGKQNMAWHRKLNGVARQGECVTLIFKKPTSIQPKMVILHQEPTILADIIATLDLDNI